MTRPGMDAECQEDVMLNAAADVLDRSPDTAQIASTVLLELTRLFPVDDLDREPLADLTCIPDTKSRAHLYALAAIEPGQREHSDDHRVMLEAARRTLQPYPEDQDSVLRTVVQDIEDLFGRGALDGVPLVACACLVTGGMPYGHEYMRVQAG